MADLDKNSPVNKIYIAAAVAIVIIALTIFLWPKEVDPFYEDRELISEASEMHIELVRNGLDRGVSVGNVHMVESENPNHIYLGGLLRDSVLRGIFACWLLDEEAGEIYAVDFLAEEFTRFTPAVDAGYEIRYPSKECGILADFLEQP
jgi:hypothetical protein